MLLERMSLRKLSNHADAVTSCRRRSMDTALKEGTRSVPLMMVVT